MKSLYLLFSVTALLLLTAFAWADNPTLTVTSGQAFPAEVQPGNEYTFHLQYKQSAGDPPKQMKMLIDTPDGPTSVDGQVTGGGNPEQSDGQTITWVVKPISSGTYHYHFQVTSSTGGVAQYPAASADPEEFLCISIVTKVVILVLGLVISLLFLPFLVYAATRAINRRGDPAAAARVALVLGVAASLGLMLCLFVIPGFQYSWLGWALGILTLFAVFVVLFSRRRVA